MTEREMLDGCLKGDGASQRKLFELHSPRVYSLILRYVAQEDAAADVLQETFLRIFDSVSRFVWRGEGSLRAWIDRIAVNMALNYVRDNRKESLAAQQPVESLGDDEPYEPEPSMVDKIDSNTLMGFIADLPDGYRTVFNLVLYRGLLAQADCRETRHQREKLIVAVGKGKGAAGKAHQGLFERAI